ncbi:hypothetical protein Tco_0254603, partial [Tanacetum coccineum]
YREYDLAQLKLVFEFSIYTVWKSVRYGVSNGLDTAYWSFLEQGPRLISSRIFTYYISNTAYWSSGYGVLIFFPLLSLVSAGTDTPYLP